MVVGILVTLLEDSWAGPVEAPEARPLESPSVGVGQHWRLETVGLGIGCPTEVTGATPRVGVSTVESEVSVMEPTET